MTKLPTLYADIGTAKIAYHEYGEGPALILLHGNSGSKSFFARYQTQHFTNFHTVAVDSRGHGETISDDSEYSIRQFSEDVIALCRVKGITQAAAIGYSDGGNIALFLALKAPDLFSKIVAISPNYLVSGSTDGTLKLIRATDRVLRTLEKLGFSTHRAVMRNDLMLRDIGLTPEDLGCIQTSMRILYAENDMIKEEHIRDMGKRIPGVTIKKINKCNHMTILYKDEAVAEIKGYLQG